MTLRLPLQLLGILIGILILTSMLTVGIFFTIIQHYEIFNDGTFCYESKPPLSNISPIDYGNGTLYFKSDISGVDIREPEHLLRSIVRYLEVHPELKVVSAIGDTSYRNAYYVVVTPINGSGLVSNEENSTCLGGCEVK